jgi:hypothetical protein
MSDYVKFVGLLDAGPKDYENPPCEFCGEEQHALLAFGVNGYSAILQATPAVICDMREAGISPVDIWGVSPGLYEWHGYIRYRSNGEGYDPDVDYDGDIKPVTEAQWLRTQHEWTWTTDPNQCGFRGPRQCRNRQCPIHGEGGTAGIAWESNTEAQDD